MERNEPSSLDDETGIDNDLSSALTLNFAEAARSLGAAGSVEDTLSLVLRLAVTMIEGCDYAGLFVREENVVSTPLYTDPLVVDLDALQHRTGEGPCLDAVTQNGTFYADDLALDSRWPSFGPLATSEGIRSVLALPLLANDGSRALNLYARYPRAFGVIDRARGLLLAAIAGLALDSARAHEVDERRTSDLRGALVTREIIGQAQGILIERERITADQAFDILRRASQHLNLKLREVAQTLIDTGENPDTGPVRRGP